MNLFKLFILIINVYSYTPGSVSPEHYIIGTSDRLLIVSKSTGISFRTVVTPSGYIPILSTFQKSSPSSQKQVTTNLVNGILKVQGLSLNQLEDSLESFYTGKLGKRDSFKVILLSPRVVEVQVEGAVMHPGLYSLPANYTIADAIWSAGGLTGLANPMRIYLMNGKDTFTVDLSTFEKLNNTLVNRSISDIQKVFIPYASVQKSVYIAGDISSPPLSSPVFLPVEAMQDTLKSKISIKIKAFSSIINDSIPLKTLLERYHCTNLATKIREKNVLLKKDGIIHVIENAREMVYGGDSIYILPLFRGVVVAGEVMRPGSLIPFADGASLEYYIAKSGGKTHVAGGVGIIRGFSTINASSNTVPQDGDIILVKYSRTKRFAEYITILQGILTIVTLYFAYNR